MVAAPVPAPWRLVGVNSPAPSVRRIPVLRLAPWDTLRRAEGMPQALGAPRGEGSSPLDGPVAEPRRTGSSTSVPAALSSEAPLPQADPGPGTALARASAPAVLVPADAVPAPLTPAAPAGMAATAAQPTAPAGRAPAAPRSTAPADPEAVQAAPISPSPVLVPSLGGGVPNGYVGGWGDYFIAGSAATAGNRRNGVADGSINMGFGLGDPVTSLGVQVNWGIGSIQRFNGNGSVGVGVGRVLINRPTLQVAVAGGLLDAYVYGFEEGKPSVNGYGAVSVALPLRPNDREWQQRLQLSAGGGGNSFSAIDANFATTETGFFGSVGVELFPSLGLSIGQSSRATNVNVSYIPFRTLPLFVNLVAADVFNNTPFGTVGVLSIGWGDNLKRGYFTR